MKHAKNELIEVSNHLFYELWMFMGIAKEMQSGRYSQGTIVSNALLEAFTIHIRVLLSFLYEHKKRPDDVVAEDFFPKEKDWLEYRPEMPISLKNVNRRVGKEVAHLTYFRLKVTPDTKPWPFVDITKDMVKVFDKFLEEVPKDFLHTSWNQYCLIKNKNTP